MSAKHLHIIALDVPSPPDYGGAIDMYFRIQALHELGYEITLHCFEYGRGRVHPDLDLCTRQVHYYSRKKPLLAWFSKVPFIVKTRRNQQLLRRLLSDQDPILFEGLHTTYFLNHPHLNQRIKLVRTHNVEHEYYSELSRRATGKEGLFFRSEARKLRAYERVLMHADHLLAIQENDLLHFQEFHPSVHLLPASIPHIRIQEEGGTEPYCLFHGNLSVAENEHAVLQLLEVFSKRSIRLVIAGKNPSELLMKRCKGKNSVLHGNPSHEQMEKLILQAHVHVLYTDQPTGLKLKLLSALSTKGHVLVNPTMVVGSSLGEFCVVASSLQDFPDEAHRLLGLSTQIEDLQERHAYLRTHFDTVKNCRLIDQLITS